MMLPQQYCLRWKYHHSNLQTMFSQLLDRGCFCDVTLACEGQILRCHRVVLCACSTYFDTLLTNYTSDKETIIIMKDVKFADIKCLIEFMYKGEINVEHASLASLLKTAEDLKIKGLAEVSWREDDLDIPIPEIEQRCSSSLNDNLEQEHQEQQQQPQKHSQIHMENHSAARMPSSLTTASPRTNGGTVSAGENTIPAIGQKRKRGRPPLDEEYDVFSTPKITHIESGATVAFDENKKQQQKPQQQIELQPETIEEDITPDKDLVGSHEEWLEPNIDESEPAIQSDVDDSQTDECDLMQPKEEKYEPEDLESSDDPSFTVSERDKEAWKDVIKMDAYLAKGRRPHFWEESFTKRVLEAIKTKDLEMKKAAKILGVSYGTLYGRYREVYGCLKHPYRGPPMISRHYRELWGDKTPAEFLDINYHHDTELNAQYVH